jgi:MoxR-like ATPase
MDQSIVFPMKQLRTRLPELLAALEAGLIERRRIVRLCLLAALAGEHSLLIGPPGTAKSELARRLHAVFRNASYFERLLTRFSVPEELFGPLSIKALEDDRYERHTAGFLPEASVAFIDEVFKANSAILNALLTLLNEREFDNGSGRQHCPLITAIGATNEVPEDEVAEAFFDRFLVRVPVEPVTDVGFCRLLETNSGASWLAPRPEICLDAADLAALNHAADQVTLPGDVFLILGQLRAQFVANQTYVSDRRWVKIVRLLRVAAASEGRSTVALWDLLLLPWCTAPDASRQAVVSDWLQTRLGIRVAMSPPRLTRVVEAFEAQLDAELKANDLDYDDSGRLRFSADGLAQDVGDAKGGAKALRMTYSRQRRYGKLHIAARTGQLDELLARIDGYTGELSCQSESLAEYSGCSLWLDSGLTDQVLLNLAATGEALSSLRGRAANTRQGFLNLPKLLDDGDMPPPVDHESLIDT